MFLRTTWHHWRLHQSLARVAENHPLVPALLKSTLFHDISLETVLCLSVSMLMTPLPESHKLKKECQTKLRTCRFEDCAEFLLTWYQSPTRVQLRQNHRSTGDHFNVPSKTIVCPCPMGATKVNNNSLLVWECAYVDIYSKVGPQHSTAMSGINDVESNHRAEVYVVHHDLLLSRTL